MMNKMLLKVDCGLTKLFHPKGWSETTKAMCGSIPMDFYRLMDFCWIAERMGCWFGRQRKI